MPSGVRFVFDQHATGLAFPAATVLDLSDNHLSGFEHSAAKLTRLYLSSNRINWLRHDLCGPELHDLELTVSALVRPNGTQYQTLKGESLLNTLCTDLRFMDQATVIVPWFHLIIIGEEYSGKSTLVNRLSNQDDSSRADERTPGLTIRSVTVNISEVLGPKASLHDQERQRVTNVTWFVYDFAGQRGVSLTRFLPDSVCPRLRFIRPHVRESICRIRPCF